MTSHTYKKRPKEKQDFWLTRQLNDIIKIGLG